MFKEKIVMILEANFRNGRLTREKLLPAFCEMVKY